MVNSHLFALLRITVVIGFAINALPVHSVSAAGSTYRVKPGGLTSGACGNTWGTSCDLQYAISLAQTGDQLWVTEGTYTPTSGTDRTISFRLKSGVAIYGGFTGSETELTGRDPATYPTVLSGDIGVAGDTSDNSYHVVYVLKVDNTGILDGFTVEGGYANGTDAYSNGGGLYSYLSSASVANITFTSNTAQGKGGGVYSYESNGSYFNITFNDNAAGVAGGGMFNSISNSSLTNVSFNRNSAGLHGGGMYIIASTPSITEAAFNENSAVEHGGAILHTDLGESVITNATFNDNTAGRFGGAIANFSSSPEMNDVIIEGNHGSSGGAIYNQYGSPVFNTVAFSNNTAAMEGGGIYNEDSNPTFSDVVFSRNSAEKGGGLFFYLGSSQLSGVDFSNNSANYSAGGLYSYECDLTMADMNFSSNTAGTRGGGMVLYYGTATMSDILFEYNSAPTYAGGIDISGTSPTIDRITFSGNTSNRGGGMYIYHSSPVITNARFLDNSAQEHGGGFYTYSSSPVLTNASFSNNTAQSYGGGMYNVLGTPVLTNVTFTKNYAKGYGGGMFKSGGGFTLNNATFTNNIAGTSGGGLTIGDSDAYVNNTIFWGNTAGSSGPQIVSFDTGVPIIDTSILQGGCPVKSTCTDILTTDPLLGTLGDYGGFTPTIPILIGSSAIDTGNDAACTTTDQRGVSRPQGIRCDIGAYEFEFDELFTVSGRVMDESGVAIPGVIISDGAGRSVTTDAEGNYIFTGFPQGSHTITPAKTGYTFDPQTIEITINSQEVSGLDFTGAPVPIFSLLPAIGEILTTSKVTFDWPDTPGAVAYRIQLSLYKDFRTLVFGAKTTSSDYFYDTFLKFSTTYFWRIKPIYADSRGPWSPVYRFKSMDPLAAPALTAPAQRALVSSPVTLSWESVVNGVTYKVLVAKDPIFAIKVAARKTNDLSTLLSLSGGKYYWKVRAIDASGKGGPWSVVRIFKVPIEP